MLQVLLVRSWVRPKGALLRFPPRRFRGGKYIQVKLKQYGQDDPVKQLAFYVQEVGSDMILKDLLLLKRVTRMPELRGDPEPTAILTCKYHKDEESMQVAGQDKYEYNFCMMLKDQEVLNHTIVTTKPWGFLLEPQTLLKGVDTYGLEALQLIPIEEGNGEDEPDRIHQGFKNSVMAAYKSDFVLKFERNKLFFEDYEGNGIQHSYLNHLTHEWQFLLERLSGNWDESQAKPHESALAHICNATKYCMQYLAPYELGEIIKPRHIRRAIGFFTWLNSNLVLALDLPEEMVKSEVIQKVLQFLSNPKELDLSEADSVFLANEVPAFIQGLCDSKLHPEFDSKLFLLTHELEQQVKLLSENTEARAFSYLQKGMIWRTKFWNSDIFRLIVRDIVSHLAAPFKIVQPLTGYAKWQGTNAPLHLMEVFGHWVAIHSHHLMYTPTATENFNIDESTWKRADLHRIPGDKIRLLSNSTSTQPFRLDGCIFMQTPESIISIDLKPLNKDQPPVSSVLLELNTAGVNPEYRDRNRIVSTAMSHNYAVAALEWGGFQINSLSVFDRMSSTVTIEEFTIRDYYNPERLYLFRSDLLVVWYSNQPILASFEIKKTSSGISLHLTSQQRVSNGWSYRYTEAAPLVLDCWGKVPLILTRSGCRDGLHISLFSVFNNKLQQVGTKHIVEMHPGSESYLRHHRDHGLYFCDPKTRRVSFYATWGQYGEGYTISVHPLKLLLN